MKNLHPIKAAFLRRPWLFTVSMLLLATISVGLLFGIQRYYFPPVQRIEQDDLASGLRIVTTSGPMVIQLDSTHRFAIAQFTRYLRSDFYTGTRIHRIVPDLLIQTGDPLSKYEDMRLHWGEGGSGSTFLLETSPTDAFVRGAVALADTGTGTYGSQFFIVAKDTPWLKGKATIVGHLTEGFETLDAIQHSAVDSQHRPLETITLTEVSEL